MNKFNNNYIYPEEEDSIYGIPQIPRAGTRSLFEIAWHRRGTVLALTILTLVMGLVYLMFATPKFTSTSKLYIEKKGPKILGEAESIVTGYKDYLHTQAELLKSFPVLSAVIKKHGIREMKTLSNKDDPIGYLNRKVDVSVGKKDDIISVSFDSADPVEAAQLVNTLVDSYITYQSSQKRGTNTDILKIVQKEKAKREAELAEKLEFMEKFRQKYGVPTSESRSFMFDELYRLNLRLTDLSQHVTDKHPAVKATKEKIARILEQYDLITEYSIMQSDWEKAKSRCDILDKRIEELSATEDVGALNISILEVAQPTVKPSKPQKARVMAIAMVLGLMFGGGLALLRDFMDHKFRSSEEIGNILGIPVLGSIPSMSQEQSVSERGQKVYLDSSSRVAEAYRTIRTAVFFSVPPSEAKTLLVTSPAPGEGKTTLVSNLAIAMAQAGQKTLVLDADFRKPMQHSIFKISQERGLSSVLTGAATLEEAIQTNVIDGLDVLPIGPTVSNPSEILNSGTYAGMLKKLADKYDRIIIDSPPSIPVTDAQILAALSDATLLVIKAESSTKRTSLHTRDNLLNVGATLLGTVVNDVSKNNGRYGYSTRYKHYGHSRKKDKTRIIDIDPVNNISRGLTEFGGSKQYSVADEKS